MTFSLVALASLSAISALTIRRMRRPKFVPVELSAVRFFLDEPPSESRRQWVLCPPQWRDRSYLMQMAALVLLLLAAGLQELTAPIDTALRVDIYVDGSGSMQTTQDGRTRSEMALEVLRQTLDKIEATEAASREVRVSTFDLDVDERVEPTSDLSGLRPHLEDVVRSRLLGTDLSALQRFLSRRPLNDSAWWPTHVVVISDQPAPKWSQESQRGSVQWLGVAKPVASHGITRIEPVRHPLSGGLVNLRVHVQARGKQPLEETTLTVSTGSAEPRMESFPVAWDGAGYARFDLARSRVFQAASGEPLRLELSGRDAWPADNRATVLLPDQTSVAVRWQVPGATVPDLPGWSTEEYPQVTGRNGEPPPLPRLVVTDFAGCGEFPESIPLLVVGHPDGSPGPAPNGADDWFLCSVFDDSPFLRDVNLDALEGTPEMKPLAAETLLLSLGQSDRPLTDVHVALAAFRGSSYETLQVALASLSAGGGRGPIVWMPLLPDFQELPINPETASDSDRQAAASRLAWQAVFLNSVSWLLSRDESPLFGLTDREHPEPNYEQAPFRLPLHPGEGDTSGESNTRAVFDPAVRIEREEPGMWWQLPVLLALVLLTVERVLALTTIRSERGLVP